MYAILKDKKDPLHGSILRIVAFTNLHFECVVESPSNDKWSKGDVDLFRPSKLDILDFENDIDIINKLLNGF